ncbi:MAG: hydrolase [Coxiella sp. (in: Bacteria)]|nr:MAG: hydrolase [Coxiella sp. (in: g-proteobacteria)]
MIMLEQPSFQPPWWLRNKHVQSIYASVIKSRSTIDLNWEEFTLSDGDFIDIAWAGPAPSNAPILVLLHGLEGSAYSHYIQEMLDLFVQHDWRIAVMHFRSCSGRLNRHEKLYNAEETRDVKEVMDHIAQRFPGCPMFAMGFSLGGNVLMRYLAQNSVCPVQAGIAVSMPFELAKSADFLVPFYQHVLLRSLKKKIEAKIMLGMEMPIDLKSIKFISSLRRFDAMITTPMFGYASVDDYYEKASSRPLLKQIEHPALILHAMDDPFVPADSVPDVTELSPSIQFEISQHGGHMGFIKGGLPWKPSYWFAQRVVSFFERHMVV